MKEAYFWVEKETPEPWWVMAYFGVKSDEDLDKIFGTVLAAGAGRERAENAVAVLSKPNTGYILTDVSKRTSVFVVSYATEYVEFFNTVAHELQHLTADICDYFGISHTSERAAYIQGEIGANIYPAVALMICPKCKCGEVTRNTRQLTKRQYRRL